MLPTSNFNHQSSQPLPFGQGLAKQWETMKKIPILSAVTLLSSATICNADALELEDFGGRVRVEHSSQTHNDYDRSLIRLQPEWELSYGDSTEIVFKPRVLLSPGQFDAAYNDQVERSEASEIHRYNDYVSADPFELHLQTRVGDGYMTLGKQQVFWGAADGLRVMDLVNPVDFRDFIMAEPIDSRIPLWMANYQRRTDWGQLQLLWIPDNTYSDYVADPDGYFLTSPKIIASPPPSTTAISVEPLQRPDGDWVEDADYGAKISRVVDNWDLSFNYLYHYNDEQVVRRRWVGDEGLVSFQPSYERTHTLGGSFSAASGQFVYRGEYAFDSHRYILSEDIQQNQGIERRQDFSYVLGIDWYGWTDHFVSAQLFQSVISGNDEGLVRDKVDSTLTLNFSRDFTNQIWRIEGLFLYSLNDRDSAFRGRVMYDFDDRLSAYLQYENYAGNSKGVFGQFEEKDRLMLYFDYFF